MKEFAIEVKNFSYSYGNGDILHSADFHVKEGEYLTIVGPDGAGKTTLLKNIIRILRGGSGVICVDSKVLDRNFGRVPFIRIRRSHI